MAAAQPCKVAQQCRQYHKANLMFCDIGLLVPVNVDPAVNLEVAGLGIHQSMLSALLVMLM